MAIVRLANVAALEGGGSTGGGEPEVQIVDGALLAGPRTGKEYAKFTLKKGLPTDQRPRSLAVENQPHSVDAFNGVIQ